MKKLSTNLVVAVVAFFFGLASASALSRIDSDDVLKMSIGKTDALGNICAHQD